MPVDTLASLKASFSAYSGQITRQVNRFDKLKTLSPTPTSLAQVRTYLQAAQTALSKLEDVFFELVDDDPTLLDDYQRRVLDASDKFDDLAKAIGDFLHAAEAAPAAPVAAAPPVAPHQQVKVVQDLKPSKLSLDNTPAEFHLWTEAFKAYFSASHLERLSPDDQHAFLFACLDVDLHKRVRPRVRPTTPVFTDDDGGDSVIGFLEDIFLHRYPLVQRRFEFFQYPHSMGQSASLWISELRMRGDIADLDNLTTDELYAFRVITGIRDPDLQDELLKLQSPTMKDVEAAVLLYEAKLSTKAKTSLNRVQARNDRPQCQKPRGARGDDDAPPWRCGRCNKSNHFARNCLYSPSITCHQCERRGHIAPACRTAAARAVLDDSPDPGIDEQPPVSIRLANTANQPTPRIRLQFTQGTVQFSFLALPDTGATRTIVAMDLVHKHNLNLDTSRDVILVANGDRIQCSGCLSLTVSFGDITTEINALVTPDLKSDILLSWHDLKALKILPEHFPMPIICAVSSPELNKLFQYYSDVLSDTLGTRCLQGPPMRIHLRTDVHIQPFKIYTTKQVPLHLQSEADAAVQRALDDGVICKETSPTDWCCRGGFVPKPNGKLRLITDFIPLNKYVLRPVHPFPSALDIIQSVSPDSQVFAVMDCTMGYFQVPLDDKSSKLTTFLLPQGRFRYLRAPMGLSASSDEFCRRSDDAIAGLEGVQKLVDDILIQAPNINVLIQCLTSLLERCRHHGLTLSQRKAQFSLSPNDPPVKFAGFLVSARGVQPDTDKISALQNFPVPHTASELRSFLGLANQLGFFVPDLAHLTSHMRQLLKKGVAYVWSHHMDTDFQKIKDILSSNLVVHPFDPALKTQLLTDASRIGLGFALLQLAPDGTPRLIHCGSRSLIPAESRYAIIELECLAVIYAMEKCNYYLRGLPTFQLITDHRPLVGLFERCLTDVSNPRIQRFRERIAAYTFQVVWIAGKTNNIADALSRAPHFPLDHTEYSTVCSVVVDDARIMVLGEAASEDHSYKLIIEALLQGLNLATLPQTHPARQYSNVWDRLSVSQGLLILDYVRIIPPASQRSNILQKLHAPHQGIVRTRKQAQQLYYWPGMNNSIKLMTESCSLCQMLQPSQRPEPQIHSRATFPMEDVSVDPFEYGGAHYILMVDRFSGYLWVDKLKDQCTKTLLDILTSWFLDYGFPVTLRSDGGPQFRSEFDSYCKRHGIAHDKSSPLYPEANGHAESNVKTVKHLLIKCLAAKEDFRVGLMELRNTPRDDNFSPAQLFFGRRQRTALPCLPKQLATPVDISAGTEAREKALVSKRGGLDADVGTRPLSKLLPHQSVLMQDVRSKRWLNRGKVLSSTATGRSYWIQLDNGKVLWRNRRYLRPVGPLTLSAASDASTIDSWPHAPPSQATRVLRPSRPVDYRTSRPYNRRK